MGVYRYIFTGEYEDTVGTCVLFEEESHDEEDQLTYMCHTAKKLAMTRSFLTSKNDDTDAMSFLREDNPYHRRAMKLASSCSKRPTSDGKEETDRNKRPREGAGDVEMADDVETEPSKHVESHVGDSSNRIPVGEKTQPENDGDKVTSETVDREKETPSSLTSDR